MPEISHQQAEALRALEWLLSADETHRREGRSMMMALAFLRFAYNELHGRRLDDLRARWIRVVDHLNHVGGLDTSRIVLAYVADIAHDAGLDIEINHSRASFRIRGHLEFVQDPDSPRRYLFEEFVETNIQRGVPREAHVLMAGARTGVRAGMTTQAAIEGMLAYAQHMREEGRLRNPPTDPDEEEVFVEEENLAPVRRPRGLRQEVITYVTQHPGLTATQVANALNEPAASVSSVLVREVGRRNLRRESGQGPRGGWIYFPLVPYVAPEPIIGPSIWQLLRQNLFT